MKLKNKIHFIMTGGTIDSYYDGSRDTVVPNTHSVIPQYIKTLKLYSSTEFTEVCMKDSRDIIQQDLKNILKVVEKSPNKKIIITHGTYTLPDTARFLKANLNRKDQTIILTGSMVPLSGFFPSDAPFNIGYSIGKIQDLSAGIHVCINGRVFTAEEVSKEIKKGRFYSIFGEK